MTIADIKVGDELDVAGFVFMRVKLPSGMLPPTGQAPFVFLTDDDQHGEIRTFKETAQVARIRRIDNKSDFVRYHYQSII